MLDVLVLSRIQFAANISFHILFPTITIALGWLLFYFKIRFDLSRHPVWDACLSILGQSVCTNFCFGSR